MDMTEGIIARFRTMAISRASVLTGHVLGSLIQTMLSLALVDRRRAGHRLPAHAPTSLEWLAAVGLLALIALALTWLAVALGMVSKNVEAASNLPMPLILLPFLGSGFVPTDSMPAGLRWFAEYQPFTPFIETLRGLLLGTADRRQRLARRRLVRRASPLVGYLWAKQPVQPRPDALTPCAAAGLLRRNRRTLGRDARGRHDPLRREPDAPGARGRASPTRSPRRIRASRADRWPERLAGRAVSAVDAHGKHLFLRFEGDLVDPLAPAHDRARGACTAHGRRWRRSPRRAWLVLRARGARGRGVRRPGARADDRRRARASTSASPRSAPTSSPPSSTRGASCAACARTTRRAAIGDALLDQRTIAGIGNLWKAEGCWDAGIDPWRPTGAVSDEEALAVVEAARPRMQESARTATRRATGVYDRAGPPVPALRHADPRARPGRRQPHDVLVPGMPAMRPQRSATRAPT